jgi:hypothetical protein
MEVQIRQKSVADVAQIHPGARAEQPKPQRFRRHFQAEFMANAVLPTLGRAANK